MKTPSSADSIRTHDATAPVELTDAQVDQVTGEVVTGPPDDRPTEEISLPLAATGGITRAAVQSAREAAVVSPVFGRPPS